MVISSRTPEGQPNNCPVCGKELQLEPSPQTHDAPCPHCGQLLWFASTGDVVPMYSSLTTDHGQFDLSDDLGISDDIVELIPQSVAKENLVFPLAERNEYLVVAVTNPLDIETIDKLRFILNRDIRVVHVSPDWIRHQIRRRYGDGPTNPPQ